MQISLRSQVSVLGIDYISKVFSFSNRPLISIMSKLQDHVNNLSNIRWFPLTPLLNSYSKCEQFAHLLDLSEYPIICHYPLQLRFFSPSISFDEGYLLKEDTNPNKLFNSLFPSKLNQLRIFTDGSKILDALFAGYAIFDETNNICFQYRVSNKTSIFTCEAMAILTALHHYSNSSKPEIIIFSDSKSVLQALLPNKRPDCKSRIIWEIIRILYDLSQKDTSVSFHWIPSHEGIYSNERADQAAKDAICSGRDSDLLLSYSDFKATWREELFSSLHQWAQQRSTQKGIQFFSTFYEPKKKPWFYKLKLSRKSIVSINRLRAGHNSLAEVLWSRNIILSPLCECNLSLQSANLVFWQCLITETYRAKLFHKISESYLYDPYSIVEFLCLLSLSIIISALVEFLLAISFCI